MEMVFKLVGRFFPCYVRRAGGDIILENQISWDGDMRVSKNWQNYRY